MSDAEVAVPGHRYQRIGICQCRLRENDSASGVWGSVDRYGVLVRFTMTPDQHAEHIAEILAASKAIQLDLFSGAA